MSMLLVHELHEARDRILLLKKRLQDAQKRELPQYTPFLEENVRLLDEALDRAKIPEHYRVAVIGRFKVGKSAFVNKLAGERLAGVDTNPETAAISIFRYAEQAWAEVELVSKEEWEQLKVDHADDPRNPEVKRYDRFMSFNERPPRRDRDGREVPRQSVDLDALVREWVIPEGKKHVIRAEAWHTKQGKKAFLADIRKFTTSQEPLHYLVNKLTIYAPIPILRDQIELIDTPGLDDTERFRVLLTEELVKEVDAILFLTESGASYSQSDKEFIVRQLRRRQIKHLQLIVTKCDATYENAVRDARENDDEPQSYEEFLQRERSRIKSEVKATLDELLNSQELTDDEGYYFIEQLDNIPVHLISTKYHDDGEVEKGGIEAVRQGLYRILSTSHRFKQARTVLQTQLDIVLDRVKRTFSERLNTLERDFDPVMVRIEIEAIRNSLSQKLDSFGENLGEGLSLLARDQEAFFNTLPLNLDLVSMQAKEVLSELEKADLVKHWRTRRLGRWGYLTDLQAKIADRIFPKVESVLNGLWGHLDVFMEKAGRELARVQKEMSDIEATYHLAGLDPLDLAATQAPVFEKLRVAFQSMIEGQRDSIVTNLDDFVTQEVQDRLDRAREAVANVFGRGTTILQSQEVQSFYGEVRSLLSEALRVHLDARIREFASAVKNHAQSVTPRIRKDSQGVIQQRLEAIESALQIAASGQKEQIRTYLAEMVELFANFAAEPAATAKIVDVQPPVDQPSTDHPEETIPVLADLREQHYEIPEGATGYTYERIFRPYIDGARTIRVEDAYIRLPYQFENFLRFCALAIRLGSVQSIELITGIHEEGISDDIDSRLETLKRDLQNREITFVWRREPHLHDREVRFDNGWVVRIGLGLDIYQKPESWISVSAADFSLRPCKRTKVDVFRHKEK